MIEEKLESLRKEYLKIGPPIYLEHHGWQDLYTKLESRQDLGLNLLFGKGLAFGSLLLLLFGGVVGVAQAAKPGNALYQVKLAADEVAATVLQKPEIKVKRRAQEVINVSSDSKEQLDEATREYQKSLEDSRQDAQRSGRGQDFANTLDEQEKKFRKAQEDNPESADKLEEAIKQTEQARGEVQGESDEHKEVDEDHPIESQNNPNQDHNQGKNSSSNHDD